MKPGVREITRLGLLTAVAVTLGYVESLVPLAGAPGVKLGLSNTVLLYALYLMDARRATLLMALKVGLSGLLFGGVSAMIYSFAGGVMSLVVMLLVRRARGVGIVGVSVAGALAHNAGQAAVACIVAGWRAMLAYAPLLIASAAVAGALTGLVAHYAIYALTAAQKRGKGGTDA